jgi:hypothetical protein
MFQQKWAELARTMDELPITLHVCPNEVITQAINPALHPVQLTEPPLITLTSETMLADFFVHLQHGSPHPVMMPSAL